MSDHPDQQLDNDEKISALYRAGSTAQPPEHIDQAIRAKARRSVNPTPRRVRSSWAMPVSMAAVLVLSVSIISLIHEEAPTVSDIPMPQAEEMEIAENDRKEKPADNLERLNDQVSMTEAEDLAQTAPDTEQKAKRQKTKITQPSPSPQKNLASAKIKEELTPGITMGASNEISQEPLQRAIPQSGVRSPAPGLVGADAEFSSGLKKDPGFNAHENCEQLSHGACLDSEQCSLIMNDQKALVCHRSINHCDTGFIQRSDTKESCETRQGCVHISEPCFCPPDVICICDGGQPPQCQPRKN